MTLTLTDNTSCRPWSNNSPGGCRQAAIVCQMQGAYHCQRRGRVSQSHARRMSLASGGVIMPVDDSPQTRASLLLQLRGGGSQDAWQEFASLYSPIIYGFARKRGLQDADAADLMQDVLRSVTTAIERLDYDRGQGSFRGWLFTITRNKVINFVSARRNRAQGSGDSSTNRLLASQPAADDGEATWEMEYQRRLASLAMEKIKSEFQDKTWRGFWLTAVEGLPAAEAARQTGLSTGALYVAKSRVLARLKDEIDVMRLQEEA